MTGPFVRRSGVIPAPELTERFVELRRIRPRRLMRLTRHDEERLEHRPLVGGGVDQPGSGNPSSPGGKAGDALVAPPNHADHRISRSITPLPTAMQVLRPPLERVFESNALDLGTSIGRSHSDRAQTDWLLPLRGA